MTEQALRDTMVMLGASLFQRGYATGGAGNLSACCRTVPDRHPDRLLPGTAQRRQALPRQPAGRTPGR
jgi:ribulose-5-phosphate 4-epimerase/fuculose-1-phosphate aldolase